MTPLISDLAKMNKDLLHSYRKHPPSRATSTTSYRSLASSRSTRSQSSISVPDSDTNDHAGDQDVRFTDVADSARSSARSALLEKRHVEKKTFSPADVVSRIFFIPCCVMCAKGYTF